MNFRNFRRLLFVSAISSLFFISGVAQIPPTAQTVETHKQNQITANENFELNIVQDRITEAKFERSTSVELKNESYGSLRVEAGAGVRGEQVNVFLRGITGRVTFRASLEPLQKRIERLKTALTGNSP